MSFNVVKTLLVDGARLELVTETPLDVAPETDVLEARVAGDVDLTVGLVGEVDLSVGNVKKGVVRLVVFGMGGNNVPPKTKTKTNGMYNARVQNGMNGVNGANEQMERMSNCYLGAYARWARHIGMELAPELLGQW